MISHFLNFDNVPSSPNNGKYGIASDNQLGFTVNIFHKIYFDGVVVRDWNLSTPEYTLLNGNSNLPVYFNIPLIEGKQVTGEYTIQIRAVGSSTIDEWYKFQFVSPDDVGGLDYTLKCAGPKLTVTSKINDFNGFTVANKTITITHPIIPGETPIPPTVTTDESIDILPKYGNVTYGLGFTADMTRSSTYNPLSGSGNLLDVSEDIGIDDSADVLISCLEVCKVHACLKKEFAKLRRLIKVNGGFSNISIAEKEKWFQLQIYLNLYTLAERCSDKQQAELIFEEIKALLDCGCGCEDDEINNSPILLT
jgi:hypothetical protein